MGKSKNKSVYDLETLLGILPDTESKTQYNSGKAREDLYSSIQAKNEKQKLYINSFKHNLVTYGIGPAGTGKTYLCASIALADLIDQRVNKIIVTRPVLDIEDLGYLPGDMYDKFAPYFQPVKDVFEEHIGKSFIENLIKNGKIEIAPLAYMRGRSFKNAWIILDEAQNTTPKQMELFLTRLGENCKVVINGDPRQKDILGTSGLTQSLEVLHNTKGIGVIQFEKEDVVRSGLVQLVVEAYEEFNSKIEKTHQLKIELENKEKL